MSRKSWLQGLVQFVSTPSQRRVRKRPAFSPVKIEMLEERSTPATLDWTGAVSTKWNNPGNWSQTQVPSATNNVLNFGGAVAVTNYTSDNDISGLTGLTINITDSSTTKDFTITGLNAGITAVNHSKTDNQASSTVLDLAMTGAGATLTDTAGSLTILNTANVFDAASTVNVPTGANLTVAVFPSSALGSAKFNLTGGNLNVAPSGSLFTNAFNVGQNNVANDVSATGVPLASLGTDVQAYPFMSDISRSVPAADTQFQTNTKTWGNNNTYFYAGEIFFPNSNGDGTGTINFAEQQDDSTLVRIDDQQVLGNTTWNVTNTGIITLPTGWHKLDLRFGNGGGGAGPSGQNGQNWVVGNASLTSPTGKGFGYRVNSGPEGTDPLEGSLDANDYRRLISTQSLPVTAATESGTTVTITTSAVHGFVVGESIKIAGMNPAGYNGTFTVTAITANTFTYTNTASGLAAATAPFGTASREIDDGVRVRMPNFVTATVTNAVSVSGNSKITVDGTISNATLGNLTAASGATLNVVGSTPGATQTLRFGTTALAGNVTFFADAGATINLSGAVSQSAAAGITKTGAGSLILGAANTYSGATTISAGSVTAAVNGALGTSTGAADGTTVASGGQLVIGANYANAEVLSLAGTGTTATNGALTSGANATFAGPITLTGNTWITSSANTLTLTGGITAASNQLTFGGAGTVVVNTTPITSTGRIVKTQGGTAIFNTANPGVTGDINITSGTLRVSVDGALGTTAGVTNVAAGGTLRFVGATGATLNYATLETFNIAGQGTSATTGAINITGGNVSVASPLNLTSNTSIGSGTAGSKLTLNGKVNVPVVGDLTFVGPGDVDVVQGFGNGSTPITTPVNALRASFLHQSDTAIRIAGNLDGVGLAPGNGGLVAPSTVFEGTALVTVPLNIGDSVDATTAATASPNATSFSTLFGLASLSIINFNVLYSGQMIVSAAGTYRFAFGNIGGVSLLTPDAEAGLYLDLDRNGKFEDDTGEKILNSNATNMESADVPLAPGTYNIAIPFTNGGGSGGLGVGFSNNGGTTWQIINPGAGTVANTRFTVSNLTPSNKVIMNGAGTVTLLGTNTYNGTTTINSGTLVAGSAGALGSTPAVVANPGGTLGLQGGLNVTVPITLSGGAGGVGAINNLGGTNTVAGPVNITGNSSIGSAAGVLNLNGAISLAPTADITFTGAGNTNVAQAFGNGSSPTSSNTLQASYLHETDGTRRIQGNLDGVGLAPGNGGLADPAKVFEGSVKFSGPLSFADAADVSTGAAGTFGGLFGVPSLNIANFNVLFAGKMNVKTAGTYRFGYGQGGVNATEAEARVYLDLDKNGIFEDDTGEKLLPQGTTVMSTGVDLAVGTYNIAIPYTNGGGSGNVGVGFSANDGATWRAINPGDPSQAGLWTTTVTPANNVIKSGAGTVTFMASNTYNGNTTVNGGTLATTANNALGIGANATLFVSGATTVVNLFDSATAVTTVNAANFVAGTVNTGAAGGKLAVKTQLKLPGDYTVTGNMTAQGANLADNSAPRTLTAVSGTLDVAHLLATPISKTTKADGTTDNGQLFFFNGPATYTAAQLTQTNPYTTAPDAQVLIVSVDSRQSGTNASPTVSFGGTPLTLAVNALGLVSNFFNSGIWYLYLSPADAGVTKNLVVTWPSNASVNDSHSTYAFTLKGVNVGAAPVTGKAANPEITANLQRVTVDNVAAGSWAVSTFGYRTGTLPVSLTMSVDNGALQTGGTINAPAGTSSTGDLWQSQTTNVVSVGGLAANLNAGSVTFTNSATQTNGSNHWNGAAAAFAPKLTPAAVTLPATTLALTAGTTLSVNGPGDNVLGNINFSGNATVIPGANPPASLTLGGIGGAGTGTLANNTNLGLKLAAGATVSVDVNGTTQFDQANVNGAVNLTGATLTVATGAGFTPAVGSTYIIISNDGTDAVTGTFTGLPQGATVVGGTGTYTISYNGGDGNDVVLTAAAAGAATTTTLVATPLATTGGSSVQFTATVAPSPAALGTVTFLDNGVAIAGGSNVALVNGVAIFSTTTLAAGSHPVTAAYSGAAGFAGSTSNVQTVVVSAGGTAPAINTITFNGGLTGFTAASRSRVINATVEFNQAVELDTGAMTVALHTGNVNYAGNTGGTGQPVGAGVPGTLTATASTDKKTWTLTWSGANTEVGSQDQLVSLKDGVYRLLIDATKVHPVGSPTVNMAANSTTVFHRLFGDTNAPAASGNDFTAILAGNDNLTFRGAFNKPIGGGYVPFLDFNGDGSINSGDNLAFRGRFNKNLTWTA